MKFRNLRTFVTVAEQGSVSKAARQLRIAQTALSRQIIDLEKELGLTLFDRLAGRLILTGEGEQLLGSCRNALGSVGSVIEQAQLLRGGEAGLLKVAASPIQIETALATFLPRYAKRYPNVQVKVIEAVGNDTLVRLERGEIHLCISLLDGTQAEHRHLGAYPMPPIEHLAACHPSFQLDRGSTIDIGRLAPYPLLVLDSGFVVRKTFDAVCRLARLTPHILIESRAPHTLLAFAEAGLGIAILPSAIQIHRYNLRVVRLSYQQRPLSDPLAVVWDKRRILPRYAMDFCELLAAHMRERSTPHSPPDVRRARMKRRGV